MSHADLVIIRPGYEQVVPEPASEAARGKGSPSSAGIAPCKQSSFAGGLEILRLEAEIAQADRRIADKLAEADTTLTQIPGVGPFIAAKILGEVGEISRIRSKASFAMLSGTAPLIASSGQTHRHRLNRRGNRQLNWALHYVALVQSRTTPRPRRSSSGNARRASRTRKRCGASSVTCRTWSTGTCSSTRRGSSRRLDNIEGQVRTAVQPRNSSPPAPSSRIRPAAVPPHVTVRLAGASPDLYRGGSNRGMMGASSQALEIDRPGSAPEIRSS